MKDSMRAKLDLFAANAQGMKGKFIWQSTLLKRLAALLYTAKGRELDVEAISASYDRIKQRTGIFSSFRGNSAISLSALLSLSDRPEEQIAQTLAVYEQMKTAKFRASDFLVISAYQIVDQTAPENYAAAINRAMAFYKGMRAQHRFITGYNDYIYATMLGLSNIDVTYGLDRLKAIYAALKPQFWSGDAVQALSQVLVLGGEGNPSESRVLELRDAFRARGIQLDRTYSLPSLGVLSLLPVDIGEIVNAVIGAHDDLRARKGFGKWSITKQELLLFAAALVAFDYVDELRSDVVTPTLSATLTNIVIAQQAAIAGAAAASAAAAASSSSNG